MITKGMALYAVLREDPSIGYPEVLVCGQSAAFVEAKMDDYHFTSSGKRRKVTRVRLVVEEVLEESAAEPVRE